MVGGPAEDLNDWLAAADVLVTDYSSSIFEWALLRRPLVLLVGDLEAYERDPGLYLDYRTEMIGDQVRDTDGVAAGDPRRDRGRADAWDAFIARHMGGCDGHASDRFVERFLPLADGRGAGGRDPGLGSGGPATARVGTPDPPASGTLAPWLPRSSSTSTPAPTTRSR